MKLSWLLLLLTPILILGSGGGRILLEAAILLVGTAILLQVLIYGVWKPRAMRPVRSLIGRIFGSMPSGLGFSLLTLLGVGLIVGVIMSVRGYVAPGDSWVFVTLGVLSGIMAPILRQSRSRTDKREQE